MNKKTEWWENLIVIIILILAIIGAGWVLFRVFDGIDWIIRLDGRIERLEQLRPAPEFTSCSLDKGWIVCKERSGQVKGIYEIPKMPEAAPDKK